MTTAYDFPELDISPILCEDEDLNRVKQKVVQTSPSVDQITLRKALRDLSISGFENVNDEGHLAVGSSLTACDRKCRKEFDLSHRNSSQRNTKFESSIDSTVSKDSCNTSSEEAFKALEVAVEKSLLPPTDSCDISCSVQSSISNILGGCRITVEMGCCKESAEKVRSRLRRMGAVVSRRLTDTTTHVVFSFGGSVAILKHIFRQPRKPFLVDPHWVYECFESRSHVSEEDFSLYGCRYLLSILRRSINDRSDSHDPSVLHFENSDQHIGATVPYKGEDYLTSKIYEDAELTFSTTMSASELLFKIDLLSKRLDRIGGIPACVLGNRCPSALKGIVRPGTTTLIHDFHKKQKGSMMFGVIRRRTHSAFPLEYREPMCDAVLYARMNKNEQDAIAGRSNQSNFSELCFRKGNKGSKDSPSRNSVTSCAENAFQKQGLEKEDRLKSNRGSEKCFESLENNSELAGLLGLHSPSHGGVYGPLVKTSSSLINNLQLESSSEEFVRKKHSRIAGKYQDGVVFTGFPKQKVKKLRKDIADLGLKVQQKIDTHTYCLISANGERTLNTLCAVIFKTPVIKPDWICACLQKDTLLPFDQFYYEEWWKVIQKRGQPSRLFSSFGKIFLCEGCSPPPSDLRWLVENSGGEVSKEPSECSLVVAPREHSLEIFCSEEMSILPVVVIEKYILDCISENAVLSFEDYKEHEVIDDLC